MIPILALGNCIVVVHYHYVQCPNIVICSSLLSAAIVELIVMGDVGVWMVTPL